MRNARILRAGTRGVGSLPAAGSLPAVRTLLARTLFAPAAEPGASRRWGILVAAAGALASIPVSLDRQPGSARQNMWAEDGSIFLTGAYAHPLQAVLLTPYAGYVSVYPRLVAEIGAHVPVPDAPVVMALGGALACAVAVFLTVVGSEGHVRSLGVRALLGAGLALFPLGGSEIAANTANAQWFLIAAAFWVLLWRSRGLPGALLAGVVLLLGGASDPLLGLFLPLAVLRAVAMPRWRDNLAGLGLVAGLTLQLPSLVHPALGAPRVHPAGTTLVASWLYRGPTEALLGPQLGNRLGAPGIVLSVAVLLAAIALALVWRSRGAWLAVVATVYSAALFMVSAGIRWNVGMSALRAMKFDTRYNLVPSVLCLTVLLLGVDAVGARYRGAGRTLIALFAVTVVVLAVWARPLGSHRRPYWTPQLPAAAARCLAPAAPVTVPVRGAPTRFFATAVPCRLLVRVSSRS